ncbi:hypothetical protein [Stenotrophomonas maltophilia]|nr:hypothetical protein [Stenotrophomonas maltophilia]
MLSTSTLSFRGLAMALALVAGVAVASDASAMSLRPPSAVPWPVAQSAI